MKLRDMKSDRKRLYGFIFLVFILSMLIPSLSLELARKEAKTKDVIDIISEKHIETARCRLFCIKEFMGPRLLYPSFDAVSYDCQNTSISCHHCYEMCEKIGDKKEGMTICNYENHMCFGGCRTACKYRFLSSKKELRPNILETNNVTKPELVINDCMVYWHFHTIKQSEGNLVMYQMYGQDDSGTWFDLGQSTKSFFENLPFIIEKTHTLRILSIDEYTAYKLEYNLDGNILKKECDLQKMKNDGRSLEALPIKPLFHSSSDSSNDTLSNFTVKVVIVLVLGSIFTMLIIIMCIAIYKVKYKNGEQLNVSCGTTSPDHSYEEIDVSDPNNAEFGVYSVKRGQITALINNNYSKPIFTVALPKNQIFEKLNDRSDQKIMNYDKSSDLPDRRTGKENYERNRGSEQFMDVVSWLRSVHSEMRFDNLGFNDDEGEMRLKHNFMHKNTLM